MDKQELFTAQQVLLNITKVIETEVASDANHLLSEGFVLLAINKSIFEDSENRFVYSLGFPMPLSQLGDFARSNY